MIKAMKSRKVERICKGCGNKFMAHSHASEVKCPACKHVNRYPIRFVEEYETR